MTLGEDLMVPVGRMEDDPVWGSTLRATRTSPRTSGAESLPRDVPTYVADVDAIVARALALPTAARVAFLEEVCPDVPTRAAVEARLVAGAGGPEADEIALGFALTVHARPSLLDGVGVPKLPPRFRVMGPLGSGGMGVVYRAHDDRLGRDVALKFLPPHLSQDPNAKRRFLVEARAAAALEHPNICTVHEVADTADGHLYIVMACYEGETLDRRIARGPLSIREALRIAEAIAAGLGKAHERGIVHRDIKPANVMCTADGLVKILDFGVAKLADWALTKTPGAVGTFAYMSPEQAVGEAVDHRSDLWSLGVVLYEMLAGQRPFQGNGAQATLLAALTSEPAPIRERRSDVPVALEGVLRRALAKSPTERFISAAAMGSALAVCSTEGGSTRGDASSLPSTAPQTNLTSSSSTTLDPVSPLARGGERKHVTVVAFQVAGADSLLERLDAAHVDALLTRIETTASELAVRFGGLLQRASPGAARLVFGLPLAREDDALRGVRAALELHQQLEHIVAPLGERLARSVRLRVGLHTGTVVAQRVDGELAPQRIAGRAFELPMQLAAMAPPDAVLVTAEARRLIAPFVFTAEAVRVAIPGAVEAIPTWRILGASDVRTRFEAAARARLTPLVGRERELSTLLWQLESARRGEGRAAALIAEAGAGKSRLLHELQLVASAARVRVLRGRCEAHTSHTSFVPFAEAGSQLLGLAHAMAPSERHDVAVQGIRALDASLEEALPLLLAMLGIASETHPIPQHLTGELLQVAMREGLVALFTVAARKVPTLIVLEDWHWADEASRAAGRELAAIVAVAPLMIVAATRPERPNDWDVTEHLSVLHLPPLDEDASEALARAVLGANRVDPSLLSRLHAHTGGNPFFLEELCGALLDDGAIVLRDGEARAADGDVEFHVPETVHGVLRTRMDRLDAEARDVLRIAAVIGHEFGRSILADVVPEPRGLPGALDRLKASGLVQQTALVPDPAYRFKHALAEDVAYDSLLEHQRATLHGAVARAIERRHSARLEAHAEVLAHHFGRAECWSEAIDYGLRAAERSIELSQHVDALAAVERVLEWISNLPDDDARRELEADVLLREERLCEALGLRTRQLTIAERLIDLLSPEGSSPRLVQAFLRQGDAFTLLRRFESAEQALASALRLADELDDQIGSRAARRSLACMRSHEGRHDEALEIIDRVLRDALEARDSKAVAGDLATKGNVLRALGRHEQALDVLEAALAHTTVEDNPVRYGALLNVIATVHRDLGDYDAALRYFKRTSGLLTHPQYASFTLPGIAFIQLEQGHVEEALATYREAVTMNRRAGYADGSANANRSLGEVLLGLGRHADAVSHLTEAARLFAQLEDQPNESLMWRRLASSHDALSNHERAIEAWGRRLALVRGIDPAAEAEAAEGIARGRRALGEPLEQVVAAYEEALRLSRGAGEAARELSLLNTLGILRWRSAAYPEALEHFEDALGVCRASGDLVHEGLILNSIAATLRHLRRVEEARATLREAVEVTTGTGEDRLRAHALGLLGELELEQGRMAEAQAAADGSLALRVHLEDRRGEGWMQLLRARILRARGDADAVLAERAAREIATALADDSLLAATRTHVAD